MNTGYLKKWGSIGRAIKVVAFSLLLTLPAVSSWGSGGVVPQNGYAEARALVYSTAHHPYFVEYDSKGQIVSGFRQEQAGDYAGATVMSYAEYATTLANLNGTHQANPGSYVMRAEDYNSQADAGGFRINEQKSDGTPNWVAVTTPHANASSHSVLVRSLTNVVNTSMLTASGVILFQSALDLTDATVKANAAKIKIQAHPKSLIISQGGAILKVSTYDIGFETKYYATATNPTDSNLPPGKTPLGPVVGAGVEASLGDVTSGTGATGGFSVPLVVPPCPGFSFNYDYNVYLSVRLQPANPQSPKPAKVEFFGAPASVFCDGYGEGYNGATLTGEMVGLDAAAESALLNLTGIQVLHIPVDIMVLNGVTRLDNALPTDASGTDNSGLGLPIENTTTYAAPEIPQLQPDATGSSALIDYKGNGQSYTVAPSTDQSGMTGVWFTPSASSTTSPTIERAQDYAPDFNNEGLLQSISLADLKDSDIYVFRASTGDVLDHQSGFPDASISQTDGQAYFQIVMPGPNAGNAVGASAGSAAYQQKAGESASVVGQHVDSIRPGEALEVVLINRATGYIGTLRTAASAAGTVAPIALHDIVMAPPNLKLYVERFYQGPAGQGQLHHTVGYQGAATQDDTYVKLRSIWLDRDGSPLPDGIDGYTGRLAYVAANSSGQPQIQTSGGGTGVNDHLAYFTIKPGSYTQLIELKGTQFQTGHFYVQVLGHTGYTQEMDFNPNPPDAGDHSNPSGPAFSYRPRTYVPVRVAVFDEAATTAARNNAVYQGLDPNTVPAVYQWPYRPDMVFSMVDLSQAQLTVTNTNGNTTQIDLTQPNPDLSALIGNNAESALLNYYLDQGPTGASVPQQLPLFGAAPEQFIFALGGDEQLATVDQNGKITFTHLGALNQVEGADLLAMSLYLNSDPSNILWQVELPGLHVYYQVADDLEEVKSIRDTSASTDDQKLPTYRLLGGMRLELAYVKPQGASNSKYVWSVSEDGNASKHGAFMSNFRYDATAQTDPNQAIVYWQPGDPDPTLANSWQLDGDKDSFTGSVAFSYTDAQGHSQTDKQPFRIARRKLTPSTTDPMQGSDVAMLENILWHLGLSPQFGFPGNSGTRIDHIVSNVPNREDVYSAGHEYVSVFDRSNPDRSKASLEKMVRRLQGRSLYQGTGSANENLASGETATGVLDNPTLEELRKLYTDYAKAVDANPGRPQIYVDTHNRLHNGEQAWLTAALTQWNTDYPDTLHQSLLAPGETVTRQDLLLSWLRNEGGFQWGGGYPSTPYRIREGGADEFASIGFNQILFKDSYGSTPICGMDKLNQYDAAANIKGLAVWLTTPGTFTGVECDNDFDLLFNQNLFAQTYTNESGTGASTLPRLKGYFRVPGSFTAITGNSHTDDGYEKLSKAIMGYNAGKGHLGDGAWVSLLLTLNPTASNKRSNQTGFPFHGVDYAIKIKQDAGMRLRTYTLQWTVTPDEATTSNKYTAGQTFCFNYSEAQWHDSNYIWWTTVRDNVLSGKTTDVNCATGQ